MAKSTLPTNFKDDILNSSMGGKRRYNMIQNSDGTVSLEDASTYDQVGSEYGASQVNAANTAVNASADAGKIVDDIDDIGVITEEGYMAGALALKSVNNSLGGLKFGIDGDGNYGYYGADDSLIPFKKEYVKRHLQSGTMGPYQGIYTYNFNIETIYSGDYTKLTLSDFITYATAVYSYDGGSISNTMSFSYNAATGVLTATMKSSDRNNYAAHVWLIIS